MPSREGAIALPARAWRWYLTASLGVAATFAALSSLPVAQAWLFLAATVGMLGATWWAWFRNGLRGHPAWTLIAIGLVPYAIANVLWYGQPVLLRRPLSVPSLADVLYIPAYALLLAGLIVFVRRSGRPTRGELLDSAIIAIAAGLVVWFLAFDAALEQADGSPGRAVALAYPLFDLGVAAVAARMVVSARRRAPAFWLLFVSILIQLVADMGYSVTTLHGTWRYGGWVCVAYVLQCSLLAAAALHPSASGITEGVPVTGRSRRTLRLGLLAAALALSPTLLVLPSVQRDRDMTVLLVAGFFVLLAMTALRLSRLMVDVETFQRAEDRLRAAEVRYRTLVEHLPGMVYIAELGEQGEWTYVSPKIEELLGYTAEEWLAHPAPWSSHVHPDDLHDAIQDERGAIDRGEALISIYRMLTRDGRLLWVRDEAALVPDGTGAPLHWQGVMTDITDATRTEQQLRSAADERRRLLARLVSVQEEERQRVANDIHDDPIQKMTAVGMRLAALRARVPEELRGSVEQLDRSVSLAIGRLRRLMFELRPAALDREGLDTALRQYLRETAEEDGFGSSVTSELVEDLSPDVRAAAYRIAQEALSNVRKHAKAARVAVRLTPRDRGVLVRISDDGVGFHAPESAASPAGHIGLTAMRERAELAGGWLRVESAIGRGTTVEFWLPERFGVTTGLRRTAAG
jgi:PAS domain S-box-containing protein